jgi:hypothetical protein
MARVIDTIRIDETLRRNVRELLVPFDGDGLQIILDPQQSTDVTGVAGREATVMRPDRSEARYTIAGAEVRHGVAALYFTGLGAQAIPRLSEITWSPPGCTVDSRGEA